MLRTTELVGFGSSSRITISATINSTLSATNLATWLAANTSWNGTDDVDFDVTLGASALLKGTGTTPSTQSGLIIKSSDFPSGTMIYIDFVTGSRIVGKSGTGASGGATGPTGGTAGGAGGHALYCDMGSRVTLSNAAGEIWGGGGGGGSSACVSDGGSGANTQAGGNGAGDAGAATAGELETGDYNVFGYVFWDYAGTGSDPDTFNFTRANPGGAGGDYGSAGNTGGGSCAAAKPSNGFCTAAEWYASGAAGGAAGRAVYLDGGGSLVMATLSSPAVKGSVS